MHLRLEGRGHLKQLVPNSASPFRDGNNKTTGREQIYRLRTEKK